MAHLVAQHDKGAVQILGLGDDGLVLNLVVEPPRRPLVQVYQHEHRVEAPKDEQVQYNGAPGNNGNKRCVWQPCSNRNKQRPRAKHEHRIHHNAKQLLWPTARQNPGLN